MHVDGFRFDLASALARTGHEVDMASALLTAIGQDPDAAPREADRRALGRLDGRLPGRASSRRRGWSGTTSSATRCATSGAGRSSGIRTVATRLAGSSDLYADDGRSPYASVNFVTAHDGFTLRDLVSYESKHNEANGEGNRDGTDDNRSQNFGVEGETDDPEIVALRRRTAANLLVTLCLSNGVPMITAGDERGRTQRGNNNPYVQDNEVSWVDWRADDAWLDVYEITKAALRLRREHPALRQRHWFEGRPTIEGGPQGPDLGAPRGTRDDRRRLGRQRAGRRRHARHRRPAARPRSRGEQQWDSSFLIWLNAEAEPVKVTVPTDGWVRDGEVVVSTCPEHPPGPRSTPASP